MQKAVNKWLFCDVHIQPTLWVCVYVLVRRGMCVYQVLIQVNIWLCVSARKFSEWSALLLHSSHSRASELLAWMYVCFVTVLMVCMCAFGSSKDAPFFLSLSSNQIVHTLLFSWCSVCTQIHWTTQCTGVSIFWHSTAFNGIHCVEFIMYMSPNDKWLSHIHTMNAP